MRNIDDVIAMISAEHKTIGNQLTSNRRSQDVDNEEQAESSQYAGMDDYGF